MRTYHDGAWSRKVSRYVIENSKDKSVISFARDFQQKLRLAPREPIYKGENGEPSIEFDDDLWHAWAVVASEFDNIKEQEQEKLMREANICGEHTMCSR